MKKIFFCFFLTGISLSGFCQNVSVENGMIKFNSIADYSYYADDPLNRPALQTLVTTSSVNTLSKGAATATNDTIPDFLKLILNNDNMVTIGNFLVKFDFQAGEGLVLDKNSNNAYGTLQANNKTKAGVMVLKFDEVDNSTDLFAGLENGTITSSNYLSKINNTDSTVLEKCNRANYDKAVDHDVWSVLKMDEHGRNGDCNNDDLVSYKKDYDLVYQRFLIYYRIIGKAKCLTQCAGTNPLQRWEIEKDIRLHGTLKYEIRCTGEKTKAYDATYYRDMHKWEPYEGSRSLSRYDCTIFMQTKHTWDATFNHDKPLNIKSGY